LTSGESSESAAFYEFDRADILVGGMRWQERKHRKKKPCNDNDRSWFHVSWFHD
jgi:3'-phosphoadenosine 5'-phosphosulfate sulfotransferase (PAPS reductase)/FAD synthetase